MIIVAFEFEFETSVIFKTSSLEGVDLIEFHRLLGN